MRFTARKYSVKARIARITLNRPRRLNAMNEKMPGGIRRALEPAGNRGRDDARRQHAR